MAITNKDFDVAVRLLSGGTNEAIYNDIGLPSIMVRKDKKLISEVISGGSGSVFPAFRIDGVEIPAFYISKFQNIVHKGRAYSLPMQDPTASSVATADRGAAPSNSVNFDNCKIWCEANGPGFHLPTIAEYAFIALESRNRGTMPRGNNNYGKDHSAAWEQGIPTYILSDGRIGRVATGSGPVSWSDNWQEDGIWDLNGNVYEWQGGYRTVDGEIQIIPDNNAAKQISQSSSSSLWKAILPDGTLVDPGTPGTLKWDYSDPVPPGGTSSYGFRLNTQLVNEADNNDAYGSNSFAALTAAEGVNVPEILKVLALMPADSGSHGGDSVYMRNKGERLVYRGGSWYNPSYAGVFSAYGGTPRSYASTNIGFRSAYVDLQSE